MNANYNEYHSVCCVHADRGFVDNDAFTLDVMFIVCFTLYLFMTVIVLDYVRCTNYTPLHSIYNYYD